MHVSATKKIIHFSLVLLLFLFFRSPAFGACAELPAIGNKPLSNITCTITAVDGVDTASSETSTVNTAVLTLNAGASVTINSTGSLTFGSLVLNGGSVAIDTGGVMLPGTPLYVPDADADGWISSLSPTLYTATSSGRRRLSLMRSLSVADCGEAFFSPTNACVANGVSYWNFNETSGITAADSWGPNIGMATGTTIAAGKVSNARIFNGTTDFVDFGSPGNLNIANGSISVWFNSAASNTVYQGIFSRDQAGYVSGDLGIGIVPPSDPSYPNRIFSYNGTASGQKFHYADGAISYGTWYHVVVTFGSGGMQIYVNGVLQGANIVTNGTSTDTNGLQNTNTTVKIGRLASSQIYPFGGRIDEVGIWSRVLTQQEVSNLYNNGAGFTYLCSVGTYYIDADGDGYGTGAPQYICPTPGFVLNNTDCYDAHANVYPGSLYCGSGNRGDGSFDYNCSGGNTVCGTQYYSPVSYNLYSCGANHNCFQRATVYTCIDTPLTCGNSGYAGSGTGVSPGQCANQCEGWVFSCQTIGAYGTQGCQ